LQWGRTIVTHTLHPSHWTASGRLKGRSASGRLEGHSATGRLEGCGVRGCGQCFGEAVSRRRKLWSERCVLSEAVTRLEGGTVGLVECSVQCLVGCPGKRVDRRFPVSATETSGVLNGIVILLIVHRVLLQLSIVGGWLIAVLPSATRREGRERERGSEGKGREKKGEGVKERGKKWGREEVRKRRSKDKEGEREEKIERRGCDE